uniref:Protein trichome birefringence-like 12 isoform X2 n=1 Tax=Rhizophora mucronata TaxID=61149 RepID=A0A2P2NUS3_RHIMU
MTPMLSLLFLRQFQAFLWNGQVSSYKGLGDLGSKTQWPLKRLQGVEVVEVVVGMRVED